MSQNVIKIKTRKDDCYKKKVVKMSEETLETILYALLFLKGVNEAIIKASDSHTCQKKAYEDLKKAEEAIPEFESFVIRYLLCGAER